MSQTAITTKYTITATTGTAGVTFDVAGRDEKQVLSWRQVITAGSPLSDLVLTHQARWSPDGNNWTSKTNYVVPTMDTIGTGSSSGYVAQPRVAAKTYFDLNVKRSMLLAQSDALKALDSYAYALLTDAKLRASVVGPTVADAT